MLFDMYWFLSVVINNNNFVYLYNNVMLCNVYFRLCVDYEILE